MATRLTVTFTGVILAPGYIDITATDTCNFKFTTPAVTGDVEIMATVNEQATEFYTRFNADYNGLSTYDTHVENNVVYINDIIDSSPIFAPNATDIPEVTLSLTTLGEYEEIYSGSYTDTESVDHSFEIKKNLFYGFSTVVNGNCVLNYADSEDVNNSIIGSGLTINLDADSLVTFEDLYSEDDRTFLVSYIRGSTILFNGWLTPEGFYESFVADKWSISLDCVDGLGFLEDLSYVDADGLFYTGKQKQLDIIVNCLRRTGIDQNILTNIDIYYEGLSTSLDILDNVYFNADRFVKDDGDTIMSCKEVLNDILEPYGATIISYKGEWCIYKLNQSFLTSNFVHFRYSNLGVALSPTKETLDLEFDLGSQVDSYYPHHVNGNQSLSNRKSIGAYRVSYKYGLDKSILDNTRLAESGGSIDEWTINDALVASGSSGGFGIDLENDNADVLGATSDIVSLSLNDVITYAGTFVTTGDSIVFNSMVKLTDGVTPYYLKANGEWTTVLSLIPLENSIFVSAAIFPEQLYVGTDAPLNFSIQSDALPITGDLTIGFYSSNINAGGGDSAGFVTVTAVSLAAVGSDNGIVGEFHTVQRETNPSAKVKDVKEVNVGDNPSDLYLGTIYKTDQTTPTSKWLRKGITESKVLLQIMGEETLRLNASTSRVFSGDVFGYVPYLSLISISNVTGSFTPIKYTYDSFNNNTSLTSKQIFGNELTDIDYELTFDYGKTVKPTIKG